MNSNVISWRGNAKRKKAIQAIQRVKRQYKEIKGNTGNAKRQKAIQAIQRGRWVKM